MQRSLPVFNYSLNNSAGDNSTLDVYIDSVIVDCQTQQIYEQWFGDTTPTSYLSFRNQINAANPKTVNVHINSGGGSVIEANAMHDFLMSLQAKGVIVNMEGCGIVASAATKLLMSTKGGKGKCTMTENSWFMIHNVAGGIEGDVNEVENYAKVLRKFNNEVRDFYAEKTGLAPETISAWMNKETWFTAEEACKNGFIDEVTPAQNFTNSISIDAWPFQDKSVLNAYNAFTKSTPIMDMNTLPNKIGEAVKNALSELGFGTNKDLKPKNVSNAVEAAVAASLEGLNEAITNQVNEAVTNQVNAALANLPENFTNAINEAVNAATAELAKADTVVTNEAFEAFKGELVNKLAKPMAPNNKGANVAENKYDHEGVSYTD